MPFRVKLCYYNNMKYENIKKAKFIERPNRFIAEIELEGKRIFAHVKNTGRCKELLTPGCDIWVQEHNDPKRKTPCSVITVSKKGQLFNIDSQAPNAVYAEYLLKQNVKFKQEVKWGTSRFDFKTDQGFTEIKGVTLDEEGIALFPDAPTERGARHLRELTALKKEGLEAKVVFILAYKGAKYFTPNKKRDPEFTRALKEAGEAGVEIKALECEITPESLEISGEIPVYY